MSFFYDLAGEEQELGLAALELWALTGAEASGRLGLGPAGVDVSRAAYVRFCARELARGATNGELIGRIARLNLPADRFRIDCIMRPTGNTTHSDLIVKVANLLPGNPDLDRPLVRYVILRSAGAWRFGEVISRSSRLHLGIEGRPHNLSHALPGRFALALANIAAAPGETLIDPCCGSGTCLIAAAAAGISVFGADVQEGSVGITRKNLAHFGMAPPLWVGDARELSGRYDAALVDFPYGLTLRPDPAAQREILAALRRVTGRIVIVTGGPAEEDLAAAGFRVAGSAQVPKNSLVRHVYLALADDESERH